MRVPTRIATTIAALVSLGVCSLAMAGATSVSLWSIGKPDDCADELALGPGGYSHYAKDGLFVVGRSNARADWPYVHPGPDDAWAGGRAHRFSVFFGLRDRPRSGPHRLIVDLLDTHNRTPPELIVTVNGHAFEHQTPKGGPDASIQGNAAAGRAHRFTLDVPPAMLRAGTNEITIDNVAGSWVLYDAIEFEAPVGTSLQPVDRVIVRDVVVQPWRIMQGGEPVQYARVNVMNLGAERALTVRLGQVSKVVRAGTGRATTVTLCLPAVDHPAETDVEIMQSDKRLARTTVLVPRAKDRQPADWVDPLLGTATSRWMLYPGPSMPFGMVKLSPDNQGEDPARAIWKAGYEYTIENIAGFTHIHSWTMAGLLTMPTVGPLATQPGPERNPDAGYRSRIRHATEVASPGYYAVTLEDYAIRAELTCTTRAGFQRYTFPKSDQARVLVDLLFPSEYGKTLLDAKIRRVSSTEIEGYSHLISGRNAKYQDYVVYFVARTDKPFRSMGTWLNGTVQENATEVTGRDDIGAFLNFATKQSEVIQLQTGISLVSIDQARLNLDHEMGPFGWDFEMCRKHAYQVWNKLLGRIAVVGGTPANRTKFYTNFYRSYCARTIWSDVNGRYTDMYEKPQQLADPDSPVLGCDAFWNTFWNLNQLWNLVTPEVSDMWVRSLLEINDKGGWLAKGPTGIEYSSIMVAEHAIPLIVGAYQMGIRNYDAEQALAGMIHCQTTPAGPHPGGGHVGNRDLGPYLQYGYIPMGKGSASNTLEYAYDDWCVAQFAKVLGHAEPYRQFSKRGESWRGLFDKETGFMRPRQPDGRWLAPFDPYSAAGGWVEGNPWQYTWFVPQNVVGLVKAMGRDRFVQRLDEGLAKSEKSNFNATGDRMSRFPINHGNQPSMQVAYLFNYAGAPWLTQKWARAIMDKYYGNGPIDGWPGDEDQGQMGAWFVMSAIGLFQTDGGCRVRPIYEFGSPLFERAVVRLDPAYGRGTRLVIETHNSGPENMYIQSAQWNGRPWTKAWIHADELLKGGTLVFEMGPRPNKSWGSAEADRIP